MVVPLLLFLVALCARILTAVLFPDPAYPDSFYYVNLAHALAAGQGFNLDYIWNFVEVGGHLPAAAAAVLPIPSNAHWMPLAALVQVPFIWLLGPTAVASGVPFWLAAAATAPLTFWIARDAGLPRWQAIGAGLLTGVPGAVTPYLSQPDNFALFMPLGALSLWACARGLRGDRRSYALGGAVVGLATLARNDGVLLGIPFALVFAAELWRRWRASASIRPPVRIGWGPAFACAALFVIVVTPWYLRQLAVFGSLSPSAASGRILWITDYRQLYSVTGDPSISTFLAQGIGPLLSSRIGGLIAAVGIFIAMPLLVFLAPFTAIGAWISRRNPNFVPWLIYGLALLLFSGLLFAVHVPYGTFLHSAVALMPHAYLLAMIGIGAAVAWVAKRRTSWNVERASRVFAVMFVGVTMLGGVVATAMILGQWRAEQQTRQQIGAALVAASAPLTDRVMSPDAGGYRYLTGHPGIVTPDDSLCVVGDAIHRYNVRWLALEKNYITDGLAPVLASAVGGVGQRPEWLGAPTLVIPARSASPNDPNALLPVAALFPVISAPPDVACAQ